MSAKRSLARFRAPGEWDAEERAWEVVRFAYRERLPVKRRQSFRRPAAALAAGVALVGVLALSPAGATVGGVISRALGVRHAAPALFPLPAPGRLLVSGSRGTWVVASGGRVRRLGGWTAASWSPRGLYLTVTSADGLAAVTPRGNPQWALARAKVSDPRWYPPTGYRVAYLSGGDLRVAAGDHTGDHLVASRVARVAPAWRPGHAYQLAYMTSGGRLVVRDADTGRALWSARPGAPVRKLAWSSDGQRLVALLSREIRVYAPTGRLLWTQAAPGGSPVLDGALSLDGRMLALVLGGAAGGAIVEDLAAPHPVPRRVLAGAGLRQVAWSPDGRWVLISWPAANQWVFVQVVGRPRILAVSRIAQQFSAGAAGTVPRLEGWCCGTGGIAP